MRKKIYSLTKLDKEIIHIFLKLKPFQTASGQSIGRAINFSSCSMPHPFKERIDTAADNRIPDDADNSNYQHRPNPSNSAIKGVQAP